MNAWMMPRLRKVCVTLLALSTFGALVGQAYGAAALSLKTDRRLLQSFATITGVSSGDSDVQRTYLSVQQRLPQLGNVEEMSSPMLLAVTELAGIFCQKMVQSDATLPNNLRRAHRSVDFQIGPSDLTTEAQRVIIDEYAQLFWQRQATSGETQALHNAFDLAMRSVGDTALDTQKVLRSVCIATASSVASLVY